MEQTKSTHKKTPNFEEFKMLLDSGTLKDFIDSKDIILGGGWIEPHQLKSVSEAMAMGLVQDHPKSPDYITITEKGKEFFKWLILNNSPKYNK